MIPASDHFRRQARVVDTTFVERNLLMLLSHMLGTRLDEMERRATVATWIAGLPPAQAQIAADMVWRIFPHDKENLSKWQQSER